MKKLSVVGILLSLFCSAYGQTLQLECEYTIEDGKTVFSAECRREMAKHCAQGSAFKATSDVVTYKLSVPMEKRGTYADFTNYVMSDDLSALKGSKYTRADAIEFMELLSLGSEKILKGSLIHAWRQDSLEYTPDGIYTVHATEFYGPKQQYLQAHDFIPVLTCNEKLELDGVHETRISRGVQGRLRSFIVYAPIWIKVTPEPRT